MVGKDRKSQTKTKHVSVKEKNRLFGRKREEAKGRTRKREIHPIAVGIC